MPNSADLDGCERASVLVALAKAGYASERQLDEAAAPAAHLNSCRLCLATVCLSSQYATTGRPRQDSNLRTRLRSRPVHVVLFLLRAHFSRLD